MAKQYYYFIAGLPGISLDDTKLIYSPDAFREDAKKHLNAKDYGMLMLLHQEEDFLNFVQVLYKSDTQNPEGLYPIEYWQGLRDYLIQKLEKPDLPLPKEYLELPAYLIEIAFKALSQEDMPAQSEVELKILAALYARGVNHPNTFVSKWYDLIRQIKNILSALNAREHKVDYAQYLIGTGEDVELLQKSHAADFGFGKDHKIFDAISRIWEQNDILQRERGYDFFKAQWIDEQNFFEYFNIDRILGYYSKLRLIYRWLKADATVGNEVFQNTLDKLEHSFSFPDEFNIKIKQK